MSIVTSRWIYYPLKRVFELEKTDHQYENIFNGAYFLRSTLSQLKTQIIIFVRKN